MSIFDVTKPVAKSLSKVAPFVFQRIRTSQSQGESIAVLEADPVYVKKHKKLCLNISIVAETFLRVKREQTRGRDLNKKTQTMVAIFLDTFFSHPCNMPKHLIFFIDYFPSTTRQDTYHLINFMNRHASTRDRFRERLCSTDGQIMEVLATKFADDQVGGICLEIFGELIRQEDVCRKVLATSSVLDQTYLHCQDNAFEVTAGAFTMIKTMLFKFPTLGAEYLRENYDSFIERYSVLLRSRKYITLRLSLQILSELLMAPPNRKILIKFISQVSNLRLILRGIFYKNGTVRYEAFHMLKVFIANPRKTPEVHDLLIEHKDRLTEFLNTFTLKSQETKESFYKEKSSCKAKLNKMKPREEAEAKTN